MLQLQINIGWQLMMVLKNYGAILQIGLDFNKRFSDDWSINASFEVAQTSSSGYNNTAQFGTEMSF